MRSIESLKEEIESEKGSASLMKWLGIINAVGAVGAGISEQSLAIFCVGMLGAFFFYGSLVWLCFKNSTYGKRNRGAKILLI